MADHSNRPRQRRYPPELKERAVRLVEQAASEGERHGAITRVAHQLDIGPESVRLWVRQARVDRGEQGGLTTAERAHLEELEREVRELELHLAATGEPDPVPERARDDEASRLVDGRPYGTHGATVMADRAARLSEWERGPAVRGRDIPGAVGPGYSGKRARPRIERIVVIAPSTPRPIRSP